MPCKEVSVFFPQGQSRKYNTVRFGGLDQAFRFFGLLNFLCNLIHLGSCDGMMESSETERSLLWSNVLRPSRCAHAPMSHGFCRSAHACCLPLSRSSFLMLWVEVYKKRSYKSSVQILSSIWTLQHHPPRTVSRPSLSLQTECHPEEGGTCACWAAN